MLDLHRKYNIKINIFSNGVNLTKNKIDIIAEYSDIVNDIILNVPSIEKEQWAKFTGFNIKIHDKLMDNLSYANSELPKFFNNSYLKMMVNGIDKSKNNKWLTVLENAPHYNEGEHESIVESIKSFLPNFTVFLRDNLSDRTSALSDLNILSNQESIEKLQGGEVIGCGFDYPDNEFFISATGNVYLCCADFEYQSVYANINEKSIKEIWNSQERVYAKKKAYDGMCRSCLRAVWSDGISPVLGSSSQ
jgi:radical SAM protein with 4Fe4S-binding SPASM domain